MRVVVGADVVGGAVIDAGAEVGAMMTTTVAVGVSILAGRVARTMPRKMSATNAIAPATIANSHHGM